MKRISICEGIYILYQVRSSTHSLHALGKSSVDRNKPRSVGILSVFVYPCVMRYYCT